MIEYQVQVVERENVLAVIREQARSNWEPVFAYPGTFKEWSVAIYFKRTVKEVPPPPQPTTVEKGGLPS